MSRSRSMLAAGMVAFLIAGCGGSQPVDPVQALRDGSATMAKLKSVKATLKFTKGVVSILSYQLVGAKASVRLPSDSDTIYTVKQRDFLFYLEVVISGGHVYLRPPFASFTELTGAQAAGAPDLAKLFDTRTGLPAVIPAGRNPKYVKVENIDGVDSNEIEVKYSQDQIHSMLPELTSAGDVDALIWVGASDHLIRKAVLSGPFGDNGTASSLEVDLSAFNTAVSIASPAP